jgi:hypothetical protein
MKKRDDKQEGRKGGRGEGREEGREGGKEERRKERRNRFGTGQGCPLSLLLFNSPSIGSLTWSNQAKKYRASKLEKRKSNCY